MSSSTPHTDALAENALSRKPRQGRSLASFERMLAASKELMIKKGSENFTLQDVSELGNVSIGSIYLRFESKDKLIHAVIAQELRDIVAGERAMLDGVLSQSSNLREFIECYIDKYDKFLECHSSLLRAIMQRADMDPQVSEPGKETAKRSAAMSVDAILKFRSELNGSDPEGKANALFQIVFATIARQYGLGSTPESKNLEVWPKLRKELAVISYAYLKYEG